MLDTVTGVLVTGIEREVLVIGTGTEVLDFLDLDSKSTVVQAGQSGVQGVTQPVKPHTDMKVPDIEEPDIKVPDMEVPDMEVPDIEEADIEVADG